MSNKWDNRFMQLAKEIASWSKDPSTQVGAVIVDDKKRIVGIGYNGFPRGVVDDSARYVDKPIKHSMVVHAEANAILNAVKSVKDCNIYIWPLFTCDECAKLIIQSGIKRVISTNDRYSPDKAASIMYKEAGIELIVKERE